METTQRFQNAIQNLYTAFSNNTLNPECCNQCAVGNILEGKNSWKHLSDQHGSLQLSYVGKVHETLGRRFGGYLPSELLQIEANFLRGCGYQLPLHHQHFKPDNPTDKNILFNGLSATVSLLCKLDNMEDVMDVSTLFNYTPKTVDPITIS